MATLTVGETLTMRVVADFERDGEQVGVFVCDERTKRVFFLPTHEGYTASMVRSEDVPHGGVNLDLRFAADGTLQSVGSSS